MKQTLGSVTLVVREYDEAIRFFTEKLRFRVVEDSLVSPQKRWVTLAPPGSRETTLLLAKASNSAQAETIGRQSGGRVFLFLETDDFWRDYRDMKSHGVVFLEKPREEPYGTVVVFEDLYGNRWDLLERRSEPT